MIEIGHAGLQHLLGPAEVDLLNRGAQGAEDIECRQRVLLDLPIHFEEAEIHREGDFPSLDRLVGRGQRELRPQRGDVERRGSGHDILQDDGVLDGARQGSRMTVEVEIEGRIVGIAAIGRLEADKAAR